MPAMVEKISLETKELTREWVTDLEGIINDRPNQQGIFESTMCVKLHNALFYTSKNNILRRLPDSKDPQSR